MLAFWLMLITLCFAAEPVITPAPEVNPTVQYLTEQFQSAVEKGLPLASAGVQEIATQIHYLGIGLLVYDGIFIAFGVASFAILYSILRSFNSSMEEAEVIPRMIGCAIAVLFGFIFLVNGFDETSEHIKMTAAPMVWALQELM
jgi:hypothetical protein